MPVGHPCQFENHHNYLEESFDHDHDFDDKLEGNSESSKKNKESCLEKGKAMGPHFFWLNIR